MVNTKLKSKIEALTGGVVKTSTYKCGGYEGYATLKLVGQSDVSTTAYGHRTAQQAVKAALVKLAARLGFDDLVEQCKDDNQRANDADFIARTSK